jgi:hypothetical protein
VIRLAAPIDVSRLYAVCFGGLLIRCVRRKGAAHFAGRTQPFVFSGLLIRYVRRKGRRTSRAGHQPFVSVAC